MNSIARSVLPLCLCLGLGTVALADEVILKNGGVIRGEVVKEDDEFVTVRTDSGDVPIPRRKVREVVRSSQKKKKGNERPKGSQSVGAISGQVELRGIDPGAVELSVGLMQTVAIDSRGRFRCELDEHNRSRLKKGKSIRLHVTWKDAKHVLYMGTLHPGQRRIELSPRSTAMTLSFLGHTKRSIFERARDLPEVQALASWLEANQLKHKDLFLKVLKKGSKLESAYMPKLKAAMKAAGEMAVKPQRPPQSTIALPQPFPQRKPSRTFWTKGIRQVSPDALRTFMADRRVEPDLGPRVERARVFAAWFRLAYALADRFEDQGFLFSRDMKKKVRGLAEEGPQRGDLLPRGLTTIFKMYHELGETYDFKRKQKVFLPDEQIFGKLMAIVPDGDPRDTPTRIVFGDESLAMTLVLEDGAWRLGSLGR